VHESLPIHLKVKDYWVQKIHDFLLICDPTSEVVGESDKHIQLLSNFLKALQ
jgi:hypothetical protein